MKIAFHTCSLDVRGTCVALYDYAHYHETLLNGQSIIVTCRSLVHDEAVLFKFSRRFEIRYCDTNDELDNIISDCDIFYTIKYGKKGDYVPKKIKTCIHCVFDLSEPHGSVYAAVSETLAKKFNYNLYVPHMIGLKRAITTDNMRNELNIPLECIVFGRHGGTDTFDLDITKNAIIRAVHDHSNIHFIFVNTPVFIVHPRVHHIEKIVDFDEKNRFIMSCDAMIHGQSLGETFGISIGEFSINNKPIIAYNGPVWNDHYKTILGDKALWYTTETECYNILVGFDPRKYRDVDLNCYKQYTPYLVMQQFKKVFIDTTI